MKGLLLKDFYMMAKYCRSFILIVGVFLIISCFASDNAIFIVYPVLIAGMLPVTLISYDEREKWNIFCETLPYTRAQIVSEKYLIGLIIELTTFLLSSLTLVYRMINAGTFSLSLFLPYASVILIVGLIGPALLLPFVFGLGAEKGRIAYYVVIGGLCSAVTIMLSSGMKIPDFLASSTSALLIALLVFILFACSWGLSVFLYKKREL